MEGSMDEFRFELGADKAYQPFSHFSTRFDREGTAYDVPRVVPMVSEEVSDSSSESFGLARTGGCENL
jgi:hypothetical protein